VNVNFYNEDVDLPLCDFDIISNWLINAIESKYKSAGTINIIFCSDNYILKINNQFLNHDYFTDIITFNYSSSKTISGDLFISLDTVKSNSMLFNQNFNNELHRVIVHGVLHLLGYDDQTDLQKNEIRNQEDFWLSKLP
jgi:probable rRNA maturation factor